MGKQTKVMFGEGIPQELLDILGIPPNTRKFVIRAEVGKPVTVEVLRYVGSWPETTKTFERYHLVKIDKDKPLA